MHDVCVGTGGTFPSKQCGDGKKDEKGAGNTSVAPINEDAEFNILQKLPNKTRFLSSEI